MKTVKFNPALEAFRPDSFTNLLDRFFNETVHSRRLADFTPSVDVRETEKGYEFQVALPGLSEEDVKVDFQENRLMISGERKFAREENQQKYHLIETHYGTFNRTFNLPENVDPESIEAQFEKGMLHILVPKDEKKVQKHQIKIKSAQKKSLHANNGKTKANGQVKESIDA